MISGIFSVKNMPESPKRFGSAKCKSLCRASFRTDSIEILFRNLFFGSLSNRDAETSFLTKAVQHTSVFYISASPSVHFTFFAGTLSSQSGHFGILFHCSTVPSNSIEERFSLS